MVGLVNAKCVSWLLSVGLQGRRVRGPSATTSQHRHIPGYSHLQSGWSLVLATRETDRVKVKNGREQPGKGSEMKNIRFEAGLCKGLYSNGRDQVPEHAMKSAGCRDINRREVPSLFFLFQQGSGMISLPC